MNAAVGTTTDLALHTWPLPVPKAVQVGATFSRLNAVALIPADQPHSLHGAGGLGHVQSFGSVLSFCTGLSYNSIYW